MPPLATHSPRRHTVASDATIRPVSGRRAGSRPAPDLAAPAPEAAVCPAATTLHDRRGVSFMAVTEQAPAQTRAPVGERDTPTTGRCPRGRRRHVRSTHLRHIGSLTAGHSMILAVKWPPRSSRTLLLLQAYQRGRCATTRVSEASARRSEFVHPTAVSVRVRHGGFDVATGPSRRSAAAGSPVRVRPAALLGHPTMTTDTDSERSEAEVEQDTMVTEAAERYDWEDREAYGTFGEKKVYLTARLREGEFPTLTAMVGGKWEHYEDDEIEDEYVRHTKTKRMFDSIGDLELAYESLLDVHGLVEELPEDWK